MGVRSATRMGGWEGGNAKSDGLKWVVLLVYLSEWRRFYTKSAKIRRCENLRVFLRSRTCG